MNRRWYGYGVALLCIGGDIAWGGMFSGWRMIINVPVLVLIVITVLDGLTIGAIAAVVIGLLFSYVTAVGGSMYVIGCLGATIITWLISQRVVTSRSTASFLASIIAGTVTYGGLVIGIGLLEAALNHQHIHVDTVTMLYATLCQCVTHPVLLSILWRVLGRDRYGRVTTSLYQSF